MARRRGGRVRWAVAVLAAALAGVAIATPVDAQQTVPADFVDLPVIGGLDEPVAFAFVPGSRVLIAERATARLRLVVNGALAAIDPAGVVDSVRSAYGEQGLLGVAVDPGWPARPYVYVQYDYVGAPVIRISRYTAVGDLGFAGDGAFTLNPASRYDLMVDLPDNSLVHNGGTLRFGPDGRLYSSLGDDGPGCAAQDLTRLQGKILRLDVSQLPAGPGGPAPLAFLTPADNPFVSHANPRARLVYAYGLRNPFGFGVDPTTGDLLIGDVGALDREEVNWAPAPGMNFGWPHFEGPLRTGVTCPDVDTTGFTAPIYAYPRPMSGSPVSVIGGPIYRRLPGVPVRFPPEYEGNAFFTDFYRGWIRRLVRTGNVWAPAPPAPGQPDADNWSSGNGLIASMLLGPDGALWYGQSFSGFFEPASGQIRRIAYTGIVSAPAPGPAAVEFRVPSPSPSAGPVEIAFTLAADAPVELVIFDAAGRRARSLIRSDLGAGPHRVLWDARDETGGTPPRGVYLVRLTIAGRAQVRRFVQL